MSIKNVAKTGENVFLLAKSEVAQKRYHSTNNVSPGLVRAKLHIEASSKIFWFVSDIFGCCYAPTSHCVLLLMYVFFLQ